MTTERDDQRDDVHDRADEAPRPRLPAPAEPPAQPSDGVVPVLPPREPAPATPSFDRQADGPTVPVTPELSQPDGSQPASPFPTWTPDGVTAVHRATNEQRRQGVPRRHRSSWRRRIAAFTVIAAAVAVMSVVVVQFSRGLQDARELRTLPTFGEYRPVAGTAVIDVKEWTDGSSFSSTVTFNPFSGDYELDGTGPDGAVDIVRASGDTFVSDGVGWVQLDDATAREADRDLIMLTRISIFSDYVPSAARPYIQVVEGSRTELRGRDVRRLEILLDDEAFRRSDPAGFETWVETNGVVDIEPDDRAFHFELWFDDDGVLWRIRSESTTAAVGANGEPEEWVQIDLTSHDTGSFVVSAPDDAISMQLALDSA